jgi:hypothetical protein
MWLQPDKRRQRIGNDAAANDNLVGCAHKISGWPRKGAKGAKEFFRREFAIMICVKSWV